MICLEILQNLNEYVSNKINKFIVLIVYLFVIVVVCRVLLERLIVNRPHPWGLLVTFIELIKNPHYRFWDHEFVHCAPEIET